MPDETAALRRGPDRVDVAQLGVSQQRILLDHHVEAVTLEQLCDRLHVVALIDLDHRLADLRPIVRVEPAQHIQLALFDVDLEQVDALDLLLRDDARERAQPGRYRKERADRKSTRLNSSHDQISYAVFCLKKKKNKIQT